MRILHTSDWHVGKRLGRHDRMDEHAAALAEVERVAAEREVDLVLVSGDVWDRPVPPMDALTLGLQTLVRLGRSRPVVAVAGNHDSPELFEALAPLLRPQGVFLIGSIRRPDRGGILGPEELGLPALVACFPFLREGRVVDFMKDTGEWYGDYATRVASLTAAYNAALVERAGDELVPLLVAHFMVNGVTIDKAAPRGERELHMGDAYAATPHAIPAGPQYVAMGHIHAPQAVPGAPVPAEYAGSLLSLDFGEAGEQKRVVIVEARPGELATVESVPIDAGRPLIRASGTLDELMARDDLDDAFLDLTVDVGGLDHELGRRAAEAFPHLVNVRPRRPEGTRDSRPEGAPPLDDETRYAAFHRRTHGEEPPEDLLALLRGVLEEVHDAAV